MRDSPLRLHRPTVCPVLIPTQVGNLPSAFLTGSDAVVHRQRQRAADAMLQKKKDGRRMVADCSAALLPHR